LILCEVAKIFDAFQVSLKLSRHNWGFLFLSANSHEFICFSHI
jgi:hypothetical protein